MCTFLGLSKYNLVEIKSVIINHIYNKKLRNKEQNLPRLSYQSLLGTIVLDIHNPDRLSSKSSVGSLEFYAEPSWSLDF